MAWDSTFTNIATKNTGDSILAADTNQLDDNDQQVQANIEAVKGGVLGVAPTTTLETLAATVASLSTARNDVTANYTILDADGYRTINCGSATADYTITFPTLADNDERQLRVINDSGITISDGNTNSGTAVVTMASTTGILAGMNVYGNNVDSGTTVSTVDSGIQITLNQNCNKTQATSDVILEFANNITVDGEGAETIDGMTTIVLARKGDRIDCHGISGDEWKILDERVTCQHKIHTSNGFGSTDNKITVFTTIKESSGNFISNNHGSYGTKGLEITVLKAGTYEVSYTATTNATANYGVSLNSNELTTSVYTINKSNLFSAGTIYSGGNLVTITRTAYMEKGAVIRPHTDGAASTSYTADNFITVTYLGN